MAKECGACGKPLDVWPPTLVKGDHRAILFGVLIGVAGVVVLGSSLSECQAKSNKEEAARMAAEATSKAEIYKACIMKADPAVCSGSIQTVRCLAPLPAEVPK